jgi:hypothetical protein
MKKIITLILTVMSILFISIAFTGCGTQTAEDITGEYIKVEDGKEIKQDNKHYYLMILDKDLTHQNKPATRMRFTIQRYNPDLDKYYYVNRDFYMDPKTLQSFELETHTITVKDDNHIILNKVEYKKVSSNTLKKEDTNYTADNLIQELTEIPKFNEMHQKTIRDSFSGYKTELQKLIYY